jgi:tyrosinase
MARYRVNLLYICLWTALTLLHRVSGMPTSETSSSNEHGPYQYGFETEVLHERQNNPTLPIIGAPLSGTNGAIPQRIEIRKLQKNTDLWTLYLLALDMMQHTDQNSPTSWYQIAGKILACVLASLLVAWHVN